MTDTPLLHAAALRRNRLRNTLHTWLLVAGSLGLLALSAYVLAGEAGVLWAAILGGASLWGATHVSPRLVLKLYGARPLPPTVFPEGQRLVADLGARAGLPRAPRLHYLPSKLLNAFAVGTRDDAAITVTDGLIRTMSAREFAAVMAHEVSHIAAGDIKVMALADMVSRMTSVMSFAGFVMLLVSLPAFLMGGIAMPLPGIAILLLAPTIGGLLQLALSRTREFEADLSAAHLTGDPEGLARALVRLERIQGRLWEGLTLPGARVPEPSLLRTHPKTADRVARLLELRTGARPVFTLPEGGFPVGRSLVPPIRAPRVHAARMGIYF
ncbi:zinc metalloprotease HtpX [Methylobrevis albus]|uniref:M48 family metalloprotease n=1 Tax=Methylobrevis albus TaxID=2793297 RepID=A0A931MXR8_9HYPH|nr:zinc metalloprotease HtpX [Methylobrevis albus]MBH0236274.1 M48 family metalloprotease [Methylobrevis albus]